MAADALYPAVAAVAVAVVGVLGNLVARRRGDPELEDEAADLERDLNILRALAASLEAETARRIKAEQHLAACEAREQARGT